MDSLMLSNVLDYQSLFGLSFTEYLVHQKASEKTTQNYHNDLRHFLTWFIEIKNLKPDNRENPKDWLLPIIPETIEEYKRSMLTAHTPIATINRHLSSLRLFFQCALAHDWTRDNPMAGIQNIKNQEPTADPIADFQLYLTGLKTSQVTIRNYTADIRHFFSWLNAEKNESTALVSQIPAIEPKTILLYQQSQHLGGIPQSTVNRRLSALRIFFRFAKEQGLIKTNPALSIHNITPSQTHQELLDQTLSEYVEKIPNSEPILSTIQDFYTWLWQNKPSV